MNDQTIVELYALCTRMGWVAPDERGLRRSLMGVPPGAIRTGVAFCDKEDWDMAQMLRNDASFDDIARRHRRRVDAIKARVRNGKYLAGAKLHETSLLGAWPI